MKCFCAEIPVRKTVLIVDLCNETVSRFYAHFREKLFDNQYKKLEEYYNNQPTNPSIRALYDKKICLFTYNGEIFISENPLTPNKKIKKHTKEEFRKSNIAYYKIRRVFQNYAFTQCVAESAYEKLWMQEKSQKKKPCFIPKAMSLCVALVMLHRKRNQISSVILS